MRLSRQQQSAHAWGQTFALAVAMSAQLACFAQTTNVSVTPAADAFVRSLAPSSNYGQRGRLSVFGIGRGECLGAAKWFARQPDPFSNEQRGSGGAGAFGTNGWVVMGAALSLSEVAAPNNPVFDRGWVGFEIRSIASDSWVEGTGKPTDPTTDGVTYQDLSFGSTLHWMSRWARLPTTDWTGRYPFRCRWPRGWFPM